MDLRARGDGQRAVVNRQPALLAVSRPSQPNSSYLAPKLGRAANEFDSSRTEHLGRTD